jgi:hypothetical protein
MPQGAPPQRKQPVLDDWVKHSVSQAKAVHDQDGHYAWLWIDDLHDRLEAREYIRALHRAARRLHTRGILAVGIRAEIVKAGAGYRVHWAAVDKDIARRKVIEKYGPDKTKWPYYTGRKKPDALLHALRR